MAPFDLRYGFARKRPVIEPSTMSTVGQKTVFTMSCTLAP